MHKKREATIKPGQAALIITYGNAMRKFHPLDGDLVVLGRAPTCDVSMVSPEIAPIHCILLRSSEGWRLRDCCGGRHATRLNGRPAQEEPLHDSDVLHIGTFSFEMRLPSGRRTRTIGITPAPDDRMERRLKSLQRSRRNLARLALRLRNKARRASSVPPTFAELERQADSLRSLQRDAQALISDYEERLSQLERAERELCDERAAFERTCVEQRIRLEKAEQELVRSVRDRLADLSHLKEEIAGTSPSAAGDKMRLPNASHQNCSG